MTSLHSTLSKLATNSFTPKVNCFVNQFKSNQIERKEKGGEKGRSGGRARREKGRKGGGEEVSWKGREERRGGKEQGGKEEGSRERR